ncbi:hypothetical protein CHLRE_12g493750v5 [Chlamydomonas reinhardtii]|uniref:Nucleotide-diphospho-sugar transferase domain-containing protein n=1 Tax=Chlamydomonas reinhardtii TaxID=3055 RepID=A0A2K3D1U5_CHLRE|nr:uncharacterized protein CHLRE_12g493750v5 [Chlamydomonas reinhardtii]PNW74502.1 hypothetical protein CHLRE_12g493750v5 [Chlamydomonas reinhardtii]
MLKRLQQCCPASLVLAWAFLLAAFLLGRAYAVSGRVCERSGYCSAVPGGIKGYIGPIDSALELKEAVEATHFRKELIIWADERVADGAQGLWRLREAGYAHVLGVLEDAVQCNRLRQVFQPWLETEGPVTCTTYATADDKGQNYPFRFKYFARGVGMPPWWKKFFTAGRAVALGYNVLAVDLDVVVLDDWYWRVKQPPLSSYHMLSQNEWGLNLNCGFMYFQNASSTGPVMWVLYDHMHRIVRWSEDDSYLAARSPGRYAKHRMLPLTEQGMLQDCVHSCAVGRPLYPALLSLWGDDKEAYGSLNTTEHELYRAIHEPIHQVWQPNQVHNLTAPLSDSVCEHYMASNCSAPLDHVTISTVTLKMPHSGGQYPDSLGGFPFNRTLGPLTAAYRQAYADLGVPLPPDPEDPVTEAAARATPPEKFGYLAVHQGDQNCNGCWAEGTWWMVGRHGWWHRHLLQPGQRNKLGMGHVWANLPRGDFVKHNIFQWNGHWSWRIAARVAQSRTRIYVANQAFGGRSYEDLPELRHTVAYAPGVVHAGLTKEQFVRAAQGLAQVAVVLGAIAAWPALPCDTDWALTPQAKAAGLQRPLKHSIPWPHINTGHVAMPFGDTLESLQCEWPGFGHFDCLANRQPRGQDVGRGMMAVEFHHLRNTTGAAPSPDTTILLGAAAGPPPPAGSSSFTAVPHAELERLNSPLLLQRLQRETMPVLWLDRLLELPDLAPGSPAGDTYKRWLDRCQALHYFTLKPEQRQNW